MSPNNTTRKPPSINQYTMAKLLPVIGEIWTGLESLVLITESGLAKVCGDDESASKLAKGAGDA